MKSLYLLRHAKSSWDESSTDDHSRSLSARGERAAAVMALFLKQQSMIPDLILCSSSLRTRQTAHFVTQALGEEVTVQVEDSLYLAPAERLMAQLAALPAALAKVMIIGHNPALEDLAGILLSDAATPAAQRMLGKFPTAALAWLAVDAARWSDLRPATATLELFTNPKDLV